MNWLERAFNASSNSEERAQREQERKDREKAEQERKEAKKAAKYLAELIKKVTGEKIKPEALALTKLVGPPQFSDRSAIWGYAYLDGIPFGVEFGEKWPHVGDHGTGYSEGIYKKLYVFGKKPGGDVWEYQEVDSLASLGVALKKFRIRPEPGNTSDLTIRRGHGYL